MGIIDRRDKYMLLMRILFILCPMDGLATAKISYLGETRYCVCVRYLFIERQDVERHFRLTGITSNGEVALVSLIPGPNWYGFISTANFLHLRIYTGYSSNQVMLTHSHLHGIDRSLEVRGKTGPYLRCRLLALP